VINASKQGSSDPGTSTLVDLFNLKISGGRASIGASGYASSVLKIGGEADPAKRFEAESVELGSREISIQWAKGGHYNLFGGTLADDFTLRDSVFASLEVVSLRQDDDSLTLENVTTELETILRGGSGTDTYVDGGGNDLASLTLEEFEIFQ
jgi:hypothetical protein